MKKFWETYTYDWLMLINFSKPHWKAFLIIFLVANVITGISNIVLTLYVIDPQYYFGDGRFLPPGGSFIVIWTFTELAYWKYCRNWQWKNQEKQQPLDQTL